MTTQLAQLDENGRADVELAIPDCPYCDLPLDGGQAIGNMHTECARKFSEEMTYYDQICELRE